MDVVTAHNVVAAHSHCGGESMKGLCRVEKTNVAMFVTPCRIEWLRAPAMLESPITAAIAVAGRVLAHAPCDRLISAPVQEEKPRDSRAALLDTRTVRGGSTPDQTAPTDHIHRFLKCPLDEAGDRQL